MNNDLLHRLEQDVRAMTEAGMLKKQLTNGDILATQTELLNYIKQHNLSISGVARGIGKSAAVISQFLSGKYKGDVKKLTITIRAWIEQDLQRRRAPNYEGFVLTGVAKRIISALNFASKTNGIAIIYGPAGIGKTMTINSYCQKQPSTILVRICVGATTARGFLGLLCDALHIHHYMLTDKMIRAIIDKINHTGRMIIIDEAHRLKLNAYEAIRDIHDITQCPIALIGTAKIIRQIDENLRDSKDWITDQFSSRNCIRQDLLSAMQGGYGGKLLFTSKEIFEIFDSQKIRLLPEAARWLAKLASTVGLGGLRRVQRILSMCEIAYPDKQISIEIVQAAYEKITSGSIPPTKGIEQTIPKKATA